MNKHLTQPLKFFLLLVLALSSACGPVTAIPSPTLTPARPPTSTAGNTMPPSSVVSFLPTVTPASTRQAITPTRSLASATPEYYSIITQQPGSECLPPLTNFAFPVGYIGDLGNITPHPQTLPAGNWKVDTSLPGNFDFFLGKMTILSNDDIWIQGYVDSLTEAAYFIFRKAGRSEIYLKDSIGESYKYYVPERLLQTKDGTLWGIGTNYGHVHSPWEYQNTKPLISRFNEKTGQFEYIENLLHDGGAFTGVRDAKLDNEGFIWILINQSGRVPIEIEEDDVQPGLYRFNPNTQEVNYFLAMPSDTIFRSIMPVSDGSIWMLGFNVTSSEKAVLSRYFPATGELRPYQGSASWWSYLEDFQNLNISSSSPLFLDSKNHLWVGNAGWLEHPASDTPAWFRIIQSPIFIGAGVDGLGGFNTNIPNGISESSDGRYWFWGYGTVRLNPKIGEWCMFTTYSSPVVEDSNHNLWMIADNKLYKYELGQ